MRRPSGLPRRRAPTNGTFRTPSVLPPPFHLLGSSADRLTSSLLTLALVQNKVLADCEQMIEPSRYRAREAKHQLNDLLVRPIRQSAPPPSLPLSYAWLRSRR